MSYPAQIVFLEVENVNGFRRWRGGLLRRLAAIDVQSGKPVTWKPFFNIEERSDGKVHVTMQGGPDKGGRRYATHPNVTAAQKAGIRWAGRRFRIPDETMKSLIANW